MENKKEIMIQKICQAIYDKKGFNILALDVSKISSITDCLIIAEGSVDRHVGAISHSVIKDIESEFGFKPIHLEGINSGDWVLIDYVDVMVHIFLPECREKFRLEELFSKGVPIELNLELSVYTEINSRIGDFQSRSPAV